MILTSDISIVGLGARGLFVLEQLYSSLSRKRNTENILTTIFETSDSYGTGRAWNPKQTQVTISNISDRALDTLHERVAFDYLGVSVPGHPSYHQWIKQKFEININQFTDSFSTRQRIGQYLSERARSIISPLQSLGVIQIINEKVIEIDRHQNVLLIATKNNHYYFKKVVLALGHQSTELPDGSYSLMSRAREHGLEYCRSPYSSRATSILGNSRNVIIKGFGLTMIDLMHIAIEQSDGYFKSISGSIYKQYIGDNTTVLIPYSLDGLPMVPKPIGKEIDDLFETITLGREKVVADLKKNIADGKIKNIDDVLKPIARLINKVYKRFENNYSTEELKDSDAEILIVEWLKHQEVSNAHIIDTQIDAYDYLKVTCEMAHGLRPFSLDYTIGQIWRELQIDMYYLYASNLLPKSIVSEFSRIEDLTKRYSFGPPLKSMMEMIALCDAGAINLEFVRNPELALETDGFYLNKGEISIKSSSFIDSVLDKPNLEDISEDLVKSLTRNHLVEPFDSKMGIHVNAYGAHTVDKKTINGLYSIGRICKGSLFGTDSILECFNEEVTQSMVQDIIIDLLDS